MQITTNIELELYEKASKILSEAGLTVDDVFKGILTRVVERKTYPLLLIPNAETIAAMEEEDTPEFASTVEEFFEAMNEKD